MTWESKTIAVQPLGRITEEVATVIATELHAFFRIRTEVLPQQPVPKEAHDPRRGQYNCYPILEYLKTLKPHEAVKIVGITEMDLFIPILTYVYGEAELGGEATVISTWRLAKGEDQQPVSSLQLLDRAAKIAVHETAHTFRLAHCKEEGCLMSSFPTIEHMDGLSTKLCTYCSLYLEDEYKRLGLEGHGRP